MLLKRISLTLIALVLGAAVSIKSAECQVQFRGMNTLSSMTPDQLAELHTLLGPKMIRYTIGFGSTADTASKAQYLSLLTAALDNFDANIAPLLQQYGMKAVLSLGTPPGGFASTSPPLPQFRIFAESEFQNAMYEVWDLLSKRYQGSSVIAAYQLLSEPAVGKKPAAGLLNWYALQKKLIDTVRANDAVTPVVVTAEYSNPAKLSKIKLTKAQNKKSWYAIHVYVPTRFLRQGVELPANTTKYPGPAGNKITLQNYLKNTIKFAKNNKAKILVSEFTTSRFAPSGSGVNYLKDILNIFNKNKFYWTFHAWAEADTWDVRIAAAEDNGQNGLTKRGAILKKNFGN